MHPRNGTAFVGCNFDSWSHKPVPLFPCTSDLPWPRTSPATFRLRALQRIRPAPTNAPLHRPLPNAIVLATLELYVFGKSRSILKITLRLLMPEQKEEDVVFCLEVCLSPRCFFCFAQSQGSYYDRKADDLLIGKREGGRCVLT